MNSSNGLRARLEQAYQEALASNKEPDIGTLRLILTALGDRARVVRSFNGEFFEDEQITSILRTMLEQCRLAIQELNQQENHRLIAHELEKISIIEKFFPVLLDEEATRQAVVSTIKQLGACDLKSVGHTMRVLRECYREHMDFQLASTLVKQALVTASGAREVRSLLERSSKQ